MAVELRTSCYSAFRAPMGVAVATSIGQPKWPLPYPLEHEVSDLKPFGLFGRDLPWPEFAAGYRERLDRIGVDRLRHQFDQIAAEHPGRPLVLLCWEKPGKPCHRIVFAEWWYERTGQVVAEQESQPAQNTHTCPSGHLSGLGPNEMEDDR
ncbi:MAG: DUF488 family protein [Solirubrobacteraceae bacterium]